MIFPTANALLFYFVLIRHPQNFYSPHDYKNDQTFVDSIWGKGSVPPETPVNDAKSLKDERISVEAPQLAASTNASASETKDWFDLMMSREYDRARESLEYELAETKSEEERVRLEVFIGEVKLRSDFQDGVRHFNQLIEKKPDKVMPYHWLAMTYLGRDLPEKALEIVELGLSRTREHTKLIITKAECLEALGRVDDAISLLETSIKNAPDEMEFYVTLIELLRQNNHGDVEVWFRRGLKISPENEELLSSYAAFLYEKQRYEEALYRYRMLTHLFPKNASYFNGLGNACLILKLNDSALQAYETANSLLDQPAPWALSNIGNLYNNQGLYSKAISYLREASKIDPDNEYAQRRLSQALDNQAEESKKADELEKKGQQAFLQSEHNSLTST